MHFLCLDPCLLTRMSIQFMLLVSLCPLRRGLRLGVSLSLVCLFVVFRCLVEDSVYLCVCFMWVYVVDINKKTALDAGDLIKEQQGY